MTEIELRKLEQSVAKAIALLSTKPGMSGTVSDQTIVYMEVCKRNAVTSCELDEAVMKYLESTRDEDRFFPPAGILLGTVKASRIEKAEIERAMHIQSLKACEDPDGMPWLAPQELVADGTYIGPISAVGEPINAPELPEGSAPALEMRSEVADRLKQLEGRYKRVTKRNRPVLPEGETVNIEGERERQIRQARGIQG